MSEREREKKIANEKKMRLNCIFFLVRSFVCVLLPIVLNSGTSNVYLCEIGIGPIADPTQIYLINIVIHFM